MQWQQADSSSSTVPGIAPVLDLTDLGTIADLLTSITESTNNQLRKPALNLGVISDANTLLIVSKGIANVQKVGLC